MNQRNESDSFTSQDSSNRQTVNQTEVGDQNIVNSPVENGGIVIQGRETHVEVNQYFGNQNTSDNLNSRDAAKIISIQYFEPETILIPEGPFLMGSSSGEGIPNHETPEHEVTLSAFRIGKYPLKNSQYEEFVRQTRRIVSPSMGWEGQKVPKGLQDHPVIGVSWFDALAYCRWLAEKTGRNYSLPNEAQWEKACRGGNHFIYPWGSKFDSTRCNCGRPALAPVGAYPAQNDYGCFDFVGNVTQWTCTLWGEKRIAPDPEYLYLWKEDARNDLNANAQIRRVVRGSTFKSEPKDLRCSSRSGEIPEKPGFPGMGHGFRVVMNR